MDDIKKTFVQFITLVGLLFSCAAFVSLIEHAFASSLSQFVNGVASQSLDAYRALRNAIFDNLGSIFSFFVEKAKLLKIFSWLPQPPWFNLAGWIEDLISFTLITIFSWAHGYKIVKENEMVIVNQIKIGSLKYINSVTGRIYRYFVPDQKVFAVDTIFSWSLRHEWVIAIATRRMLIIFCATALFFVLSYGESLLINSYGES